MTDKDRGNGGQWVGFMNEAKDAEQKEDQSAASADAILLELQEELERKKKEYSDLYERYLRMAADFDNFKKRAVKEKSEVIFFANEELIKTLLDVIDNMERAIGHSEASGEAKPIVEGVKLVYKQFLSALEKFGVKTIEVARGQEFDPKLHQAIEHVESSDMPPGSVFSEAQRGYTLKERLLRPALVSVSKQRKPATASNLFGFGSAQKPKEGSSDDVLELIDEDLN
ncbi:MAG: nucleotide exchange factor GrpE [Deltaproteobacteria bacterium]